MRTVSTAERVGRARAGEPPVTGYAWVGWLLLGLVAAGTVVFYLAPYPRRDLLPVGWDVHAYTWQIKAIGVAPLAEVGLRPGFPVLAAILRGIVPLPPAPTVVVLPPLLALALGLAAGTAVRLAFRLPPWITPVIAAVVATWYGTVRLVAGYEATLLALLLLAAGTAVLVHAAGRPASIVAAGALFAGASLSHPVFFASFAVVVGLYVLTSIPSVLRDRHRGVPILSTDAGAASLAVIGAGGFGAAALFGWLGLSPRDSLDISRVSFLFQRNTRVELQRMRPRLTLAVGAVGAVWASTLKSRPGRALVRLGVMWLAVAGVTVWLGLTQEGVPGHRALLFALPLPVVVGLGCVAAAVSIARGRSTGRAVLAAGVVFVMVAGLAWPAADYWRRRIGPRTNEVWNVLGMAGAYVERLPGEQPVIFVVDQPGSRGAYTPKLKLNMLRSEMPEAAVARTFIYVGRLTNLLAGQPTVLPEDRRWKVNFNAISLEMWKRAEPALEDGAAVLVVQQQARQIFAQVVADDPSRQVGPGLYVVRGPIVPIVASPGRRYDVVLGGFAAMGFLALLIAVGWGFARAVLRPAQPSWIDVASLAAGFGAGALVLSGFVIAAAGGDPEGVAGILVVAALAGIGAVLGMTARRSDGGRTTAP